MRKLHELLAVEETIVSAAEKMLGETNEKFNKHTEFFSGSIRTLSRLNQEPSDQAIERANKREKVLPTNIIDTLAYISPYLSKALNTKLSKHLTNQQAKSDIMIDNKVLMHDVPVDFLLDLEKTLPRFRAMFQQMPTLDPSRQWVNERDGVFKSIAPVATQTEKVLYPVVLAEATKEHPAQVKEATKEVVVGTFAQTDFSGAATSQQKADALKFCDTLLAAVKEARMRANSVEVVTATDGAEAIVGQLFGTIFTK